MRVLMVFDDALKTAEAWLDEVDGVQGVAEGEVAGERCITVFVAGPDAEKSIPSKVGGYRVVIEHSGHFEAQVSNLPA